MTRGISLLPAVEHMPAFDGGIEWFNTEPLTPAGLRGKAVLVSFWTYTCVNWMRTLPYLRAWWDAYKAQGLVLLGVHTPEFSFEHNLDNVAEAVKNLDIRYPVVVDNKYAIWSAFDNHYWPALYFVDATGHIRYRQFGEGEYEMSEHVIQELLTDAGVARVASGTVNVEPTGPEVAADWDELHTPETYLGYGRGMHFVALSEVRPGRSHTYTIPSGLSLNRWGLGGAWTIAEEAAALDKAGGTIAFRFHARDVNLVMGPALRGTAIPFHVQLNGIAPGKAHGSDTDEAGGGTVKSQRLYQLIRRSGMIQDSTFEITFNAPGVNVYVFTFG